MSRLEDLGWGPSFAATLARLDDPALAPARVIEEQKGAYRVSTAAGDSPAALAGRLRHEAPGREALPAVGDWTAIRAAGGLASIRHVLPRSSALVRRAAGPVTEAQVVAANVDVVFVVVGLDRPLRETGLERALSLVWESGALPVIVLNKADLAPDPAAAATAATRTAPGVPVHVTSAGDGSGVSALAAHLGRGKTAVLLGPSGVGKSTLVNRLLDGDAQATGAVREIDRRGRHTTTARQLRCLPAGGLLIDTPGMRELGLWDGESGVDSAFADIEALALACAFRDCRHASEPGCAVRAAADDGTLDERRLLSYVKLRRELAWQERRLDVRARLAEKQRWKQIARAHRRRDAE